MTKKHVLLACAVAVVVIGASFVMFNPIADAAVVPGSFCKHEGATGQTIAGTLMLCRKTAGDSHLRWRVAGNDLPFCSPTGKGTGPCRRVATTTTTTTTRPVRTSSTTTSTSTSTTTTTTASQPEPPTNPQTLVALPVSATPSFTG